jgi:hypothetical protein
MTSGGGEWVYKPDSVRGGPGTSAGGHLSTHPTRGPRAGHPVRCSAGLQHSHPAEPARVPLPVSNARPPMWACSGRGLALRSPGHARWPPRRVTTTPVRSYRTFSPLPAREGGSFGLLALTACPAVAPKGCRRFVFCATFRRVAPPGISPAPCPLALASRLESGLSSAGADADRGHPTHSPRSLYTTPRGHPNLLRHHLCESHLVSGSNSAVVSCGV